MLGFRLLDEKTRAERNQLILALRERGLRPEQIASQVNISAPGVRYVCKKVGKPFNRKCYPKNNKQCVHYWVLDNRDVGRCRYCGAVKDFRALLGEQNEELRQRRGRKAKGIPWCG